MENDETVNETAEEGCEISSYSELRFDTHVPKFGILAQVDLDE